MSALSIIPGGRDDVTGPSSVEVAGDCCRPRDTSVHPSLPNVEATLLADYPANPWAGHVECPQCHSCEWTMPFDPTNPTTSWRCVACHIWVTGPHAGE